MNLDQYKKLWNLNDNARTWVVVDATNDHDMGTVIASSFEEATLLFQRAVQHGTYPDACVLVELVSDNSAN